MLTQEVVRELWNYDPETGKLFWKERDRKWFKLKRNLKDGILDLLVRKLLLVYILMVIFMVVFGVTITLLIVLSGFGQVENS